MVGEFNRSHTRAKFSSPRLSDILHRKRLYDLFRKESERPVKWIQGPPGSGKTSLVAGFLETHGKKHLWYQVDETDSKISSFFSNLSTFAEKSTQKKRIPVPQITSDPIKDLPSFSRGFFQAFYTAFQFPFTLVFDNYQMQPPVSKLHEVMRIAIEELPAGGMIIFICRHTLFPAFKRLKANNFIDIIGWDQIRLNDSELTDIINAKRKKKHSTTLVEYLSENIQGWAAGLTLVKDHLLQGPLEVLNPGDITFEDTYDYFLYEILDHIDSELLEQLLKWAFLKETTVKMANMLTGRDSAETGLNDLVSRQLFTDKEIGKESVYKFHPLFNEFLIWQANQSFSNSELRQTKRRAAEILLDNNKLGNAVDLIIELKDWKWFESIVVSKARNLIIQGKNQLLINWINRYPEDELYANSWLLYWFGVGHIAFDPQESQDCFEIAFSLFRRSKDIPGIFLSWAGIINANIFKFKSGDSFVKWIPIIYDLMEEFPQFPNENVESEVLNSLLTGLVLIGTDHQKIKNLASRLLELTNKTDDVLIEKRGLHLLSLYYTTQGNIHRSEILLESVKSVEMKRDQHIVNSIIEHHLEILNYFYCGRNQECIELVFDKQKASDFQGTHFWEVPLLGHAVAASLSEGDTENAERHLQLMKSKVSTGQNLDTFYYHLLYSWSLVDGDQFFALHLAQNALNLATGFGFSFLVHAAKIAVSHILFELGQEDKAFVFLNESYQIAHDMQNQLAEYKCRITETYFRLKKDDESRAKELLNKAMGLGKKQDVVNFIFWRKSVMSLLCAKALENEIEEDYVINLIKKRGLTLNALSNHVENWPWKIKIHTLDRFELIVEDTLLSFSGKVQKAPLTMLKILISLGSFEVKEDRISDILWPDSAGDASYRALITTVQRLRRLLGFKEAIIFNEGRLSLNPHYCWVDIWGLENCLQTIEELWKESTPEAQLEDIIRLTDMLFEKYKHPFLAGDEDQPWTFGMRDKLQTQILKAVTQLTGFWEEKKNWEKALDCCQKGLEINDTSEIFFQKQMTCYRQLGCEAEAITTFERCNHILTSKLGIKPSQQTKAIRDSIIKDTNHN